MPDHWPRRPMLALREAPAMPVTILVGSLGLMAEEAAAGSAVRARRVGEAVDGSEGSEEAMLRSLTCWSAEARWAAVWSRMGEGVKAIAVDSESRQSGPQRKPPVR